MVPACVPAGGTSGRRDGVEWPDPRVREHLVDALARHLTYGRYGARRRGRHFRDLVLVEVIAGDRRCPRAIRTRGGRSRPPPPATSTTSGSAAFADTTSAPAATRANDRRSPSAPQACSPRTHRARAHNRSQQPRAPDEGPSLSLNSWASDDEHGYPLDQGMREVECGRIGNQRGSCADELIRRTSLSTAQEPRALREAAPSPDRWPL